MEPWDILRRHHAGDEWEIIVLERKGKDKRTERQRGAQNMQHIRKPMIFHCPFLYSFTKSLGQMISGGKRYRYSVQEVLVPLGAEDGVFLKGQF